VSLISLIPAVAGVGISPNQREKLERLCRYVSRPPVASERLALTASGQVRYTLKTPYQDARAGKSSNPRPHRQSAGTSRPGRLPVTGDETGS